MDHNAEKEKQDISLPNEEDDGHPEIAELINTSGHVQQLDRNFGFWSICAVSVVADNAWGASAGSLVRASLSRYHHESFVLTSYPLGDGIL